MASAVSRQRASVRVRRIMEGARSSKPALSESSRRLLRPVYPAPERRHGRSLTAAKTTRLASSNASRPGEADEGMATSAHSPVRCDGCNASYECIYTTDSVAESWSHMKHGWSINKLTWGYLGAFIVLSMTSSVLGVFTPHIEIE